MASDEVDSWVAPGKGGSRMLSDEVESGPVQWESRWWDYNVLRGHMQSWVSILKRHLVAAQLVLQPTRRRRHQYEH